MSGGFTLPPELCNATDQGTVTASTSGVSITLNGTTWTQIVASTPNDCCGLILQTQSDPSSVNGNQPFAFDIAVGAAASEVQIADKLLYSCGSSPIGGSQVFLPISIPAGTRLSVRGWASNTSDKAWATIILFDGTFASGVEIAGVDSIGYDTTNKHGTLVAPSASAHTKGSFVQMIASTASDYVGIFCALDPVQSAGAINLKVLLDLAVGAGGSEIVVVPNLFFYIDNASHVWPMISPIMWIGVPSGTRLSARMQVAGALAASPGLTLYGLYQ